MTDLERFSLNIATTKYWPLDELVRGCVAAGVTNVGLWREEENEGEDDESAECERRGGHARRA